MASIDLVGSEIANLTEYFNRTGNPVAAWRVFSLCRTAGRLIPETVMAEVDRFADGVGAVAEQAIASPVGARPIEFRSKELGVLWRGGEKASTNPVGAMQDEWRDYQIYWAVLGHVNNGKGIGEAQEAVAKQKGVGLSKDAVARIWKRHKKNG